MPEAVPWVLLGAKASSTANPCGLKNYLELRQNSILHEKD
jgi:hypothetical protein